MVDTLVANARASSDSAEPRFYGHRGAPELVERTAVAHVAPIASLIFSCYYALLVPVHWLLLAPEARIPIVGMAAISALLYGSLAYRWRFIAAPGRSSPVVITLASIALANNALLFWRMPLPEHANGHYLVLAGVALLDVTWPSFWGFLAVAIGVFAIGPIRGGAGAEWNEPMIMMAGVVVCSLAVRVYRVRSRSLLDEAREESDRQRRAAETSLAALRRETSERERLQDELIRSERHKSLAVLAGGVAHDVNNLMTVVVANADLALAKDGSGEVREELEAIAEAGDRATLLSKSLLTYAGGETRSLVPVDLRTEALATARLATASLPRLEIEIGRTDQVVAVLADRAQLQQVMSNLIMNAADASSHPGEVVSVEVGRIDLAASEASRLEPPESRPAGGYGFFSVIDSGVGMSPEVQQRIFDPFFTTKKDGSGLGLAAVLGIARAHGGGLRVESEEGHGSSLSFMLPLTTAAPAPAPEAARASAMTPATILVVDDRDDVRSTVVRGLRAQGFTTVEAEGGERAVALLRELGQEVTAAVVDMSMPGMDGEATLHALRKHRADLPIVLSSGFDVRAAAQRLLTLPGVDFIGKPYRPDDLIAKIEGLRGKGAPQ